MPVLDMLKTELREVNATLQAAAKAKGNEAFTIENPRGAHAMAGCSTSRAAPARAPASP